MSETETQPGSGVADVAALIQMREQRRVVAGTLPTIRAGRLVMEFTEALDVAIAIVEGPPPEPGEHDPIVRLTRGDRGVAVGTTEDGPGEFVDQVPIRIGRITLEEAYILRDQLFRILK